jgi:hypothetical protein
MVIIKTGFGQYSADGLLDKTQTIINGIDDNPTDFVTPDPATADVQDAKDALETSQANRKKSDDGYTVRDDDRIVLTGLLNALALYVKQTVGDDEAMAIRSGFSIRATNSPVGDLAKPTDFRVSAGENPGEMRARIKSYRNKAYSYNFRYSQVEGSNPDTWVTVSSSNSRVLVTGLESAKKVFVQAAGVGASKHLVWSDVISMVVQ